MDQLSFPARLHALRAAIIQYVQQDRRFLLALGAAAAAFVVLALPGIVTHAQSFSVSTGHLLGSAADIFNGLWPVFAVIAGLALGIALVRFIVNAIQQAF